MALQTGDRVRFGAAALRMAAQFEKGTVVDKHVHTVTQVHMHGDVTLSNGEVWNEGWLAPEETK